MTVVAPGPRTLDGDELANAGARFLGELHDIDFHNYSDGETMLDSYLGWHGEDGQAALLAELVDRVEAAAIDAREVVARYRWRKEWGWLRDRDGRLLDSRWRINSPLQLAVAAAQAMLANDSDEVYPHGVVETIDGEPLDRFGHVVGCLRNSISIECDGNLFADPEPGDEDHRDDWMVNLIITCACGAIIEGDSTGRLW